MAEGNGYIYNSFKAAIMSNGVFDASIIPEDIVITFDVAERINLDQPDSCRHCGNPSGRTDRRGMCISCGGRR